jgi:cytochrome c55X
MLRRAHTALAVVLMAASAVSAAAGPVPREAPVVAFATTAVAPDSVRQRELLQLLKQDCGSCHGMRLTGGLGPALTPVALRTKPAASLVATIVSGRPGTAMPPWRRFVSEAEAEWLVARMVLGDVDVPR